MSKRFIDTELFSDDWFCDLSKDGKLFFIYFITNCDHAGILKVNEKLIKFQTGINSLETVSKELSKSLIRVSEQYIFCPKFLKFQYPDFPKSKVRQQHGAISILRSHGLWDEEKNTYITVTKELPNSYDNDTVNDNGIVKLPFADFWNLYAKKVDTESCNKKWDKLTLLEQQEIMAKLPAYIAATPDIKYRKNPSTWLNNKCWKDEIKVFGQSEGKITMKPPVNA